RANRADLERIAFRQRILCDVGNRSTKTTILGEPAALPLALAPIGLCGMQHGDGEILACRAAQQAGIPFTLSTMSICSIEDVANAVAKPFWFQLYVMKDRGFIRSLIERAAAAKCSALALTVDLQVLGQRHCDIRNGMTVPPRITLANVIDIALKPAWALPRIADAVGSEIEVMFDGGIRTGKDLLRALALGARSCLIGRAFVYGLGAYGQEGVAKAIDVLAKELDVAMALTGVQTVGAIN